MNSLSDREAGDGGMRVFHWLVLVSCFVLFLALRVPWIGHLLSVDEATNLLTFRAYAAGGSDYYSGWFWRHPPLFSVIMLALSPLQPGFAERAEWAAVILSALVFLTLFAVNRKLLGVTPALWACFLLAVMPGSIFFDVWIKQESLVSIFGLCALYLFLVRKEGLSGLFLGLALLSKALAVFYAAAICVLWFLRARSTRKGKDLAVTLVLAALGSAWWYLLFGNSIKICLGFMAGMEFTEMTSWINPWYYFLEKMPADIGWVGIGLCCVGVVAVYILFRQRRGTSAFAKGDDRAIFIFWPLAFLVPAYFVVSAIRGKTPWFTMTFYPALATLQGVAVWWAVSIISTRLRGSVRTLVAAALSLAVAGASLHQAADRSYESVMRRQYYWMWWGSYNSREAAIRMNGLVQDGQRVLITPMSYWASGNRRPCAIFVSYLKPMQLVIRKFDTPMEGFVEAIREHKLDWIMISPMPGVGEKAVIEPMMQRYGLRPILLRGACIFKTDSIYKSEEVNTQPHE
jgi:4-amino-4-deoxy-L-arabinose transferase-like glycosyltransferase